MLPAKVKVNKVWYAVIVTDDWIMHRGRRCRGLCNGHTHEITVYGGQRKKAVVSTFFHELLHAVEFEYQVKIPHSVIYAIEGALAEVIAKNPEVGKLKYAVKKPAA